MSHQMGGINFIDLDLVKHEQEETKVIVLEHVEESAPLTINVGGGDRIKNRRKVRTWSKREVECLINAYERTIRTHDGKSVWMHVTKEMKKLFPDVTQASTETKYRKIRSLCRQYQHNIEKYGDETSLKKPPYYNRILSLDDEYILNKDAKRRNMPIESYSIDSASSYSKDHTQRIDNLKILNKSIAKQEIEICHTNKSELFNKVETAIHDLIQIIETREQSRKEREQLRQEREVRREGRQNKIMKIQTELTNTFEKFSNYCKANLSHSPFELKEKVTKTVRKKRSLETTKDCYS